MGCVSPWGWVTLLAALAPELHQICTMAQEGNCKVLMTQELSENALVKQY
jgi:hypothetical protein